MSDTIKVDTARLPLLLKELRLPTMAALGPAFTERADRERMADGAAAGYAGRTGTGRAVSTTRPASPDRGAGTAGRDIGQHRLRRLP
jgi:hypothetical protein